MNMNIRSPTPTRGVRLYSAAATTTVEVAANFMATRPAPDGVGAGAVEQLRSTFRSKRKTMQEERGAA